MPPDDHTRKQPIAPTLTTNLTREICRTCADCALRAPRTRREEPTTEVHAATRAPLDAIIVAKQKPAARLSKPHGEDAAIDQSPSRSRLRDDAPKEEKDAKTPPSPDAADLRFSSEAQAAGRRSTPPRRRFQERSRHPRSPPSPAPKKAGAKNSPGDAPTTCHHRPPPTRHHLLRPTSFWPRDPTIHRDQTRTTPWPKPPSTTAAPPWPPPPQRPKPHRKAQHPDRCTSHQIQSELHRRSNRAARRWSLHSTPRTLEQPTHHAQPDTAPAARLPPSRPAGHRAPHALARSEPPPGARTPSTPKPHWSPGQGRRPGVPSAVRSRRQMRAAPYVVSKSNM
nr:serine/arginine repetitive matrix protein 1-like [Aegilops tauschii subsp. strangulata]